MRQRSEAPSEIRVLDAVRRESGRIDEIKRKLGELERRLSDIDAAGDIALLDEYARILEEYEQMNGYMWETEVEKVLTRLGLTAEH